MFAKANQSLPDEQKFSSVKDENFIAMVRLLILCMKKSRKWAKQIHIFKLAKTESEEDLKKIIEAHNRQEEIVNALKKEFEG